MMSKGEMWVCDWNRIMRSHNNDLAHTCMNS